MTFVQSGQAGVPLLDQANTTTTALSGAATYTGGWTDVSAYTYVTVAALADVAGTLYMEFSNDATQANADSTLTYDVAAGINEVALAVRSIEAIQDIAEGKRAGYSIVNKFGRNQDVDSGSVPEDIWEGGSAYTGFPTGSAELVTAVSGDANDTSDGSGARTIMIYGLDANGADQNETITLNGTSLVDSANTYTRVNRVVVLTSGSSNQAFNAGIISIAHKTTTANIFASVPVGANQSQIAAYTIPAGKTGYLKNLHVEIKRSNSANVDGALWIRNNGASPTLKRIFSVSQTSALKDDIVGGLPLPALTDIAVRVTAASTTNIGVTANFDIILVDD